MDAQRTKTPNIRMVSQMAGVSTATVSRVLNNSPIPTETTRRRVLEAVHSVGYRPDPLFAEAVRHRNRVQSGLGKRTGAVAFLTNRRVYQEYHGPMGFHSRSAWGLEEELRKQRYHLLWSAVDSEESIIPQSVAEHRVDGIVIEGDIPRPLLEVLVQRLPTVLISRSYPELSASTVMINGQQAMRCQLEYLWELGHRRIALFQPTVSLPQFRICEFAYREFYAGRGLPIPCPRLIEPREINPATHEQVMRQYARELFESNPRPTAIVALNVYANAIAHYIQEMGKNIPSDISVAELTDEAAFTALSIKPALTTFHFSTEEVGRIAAQLVLEEIEHPGQAKRHVLISGQRIERASCAAPPENAD